MGVTPGVLASLFYQAQLSGKAETTSVKYLRGTDSLCECASRASARPLGKEAELQDLLAYDQT